MSELGGGDLETDFGKLAGVVFAEIIHEVILQAGEIELTLLFDAPFRVAATGFPIRDVAFGDVDIEFVQGSDNFGIGDVACG